MKGRSLNYTLFYFKPIHLIFKTKMQGIGRETHLFYSSFGLDSQTQTELAHLGHGTPSSPSRKKNVFPQFPSCPRKYFQNPGEVNVCF